MCCICFRNPDPKIPLDFIPSEKSIRRGIHELAQKPIKNIFIKIENPTLPVIELSERTIQRISYLAKLCETRRIKVPVFRANIAIICDQDPTLQNTIHQLDLFNASERNANDEIAAQVVILFSNNNKPHTSFYVAAALIDIFRIRFPTVSREGSQQLTHSDSASSLQNVLSLYSRESSDLNPMIKTEEDSSNLP